MIKKKIILKEKDISLMNTTGIPNNLNMNNNPNNAYQNYSSILAIMKIVIQIKKY